MCAWIKERFDRPAVVFGNCPLRWGYDEQKAEQFSLWAEKAIALIREEGVLCIEAHALWSGCDRCDEEGHFSYNERTALYFSAFLRQLANVLSRTAANDARWAEEFPETLTDRPAGSKVLRTHYAGQALHA